MNKRNLYQNLAAAAIFPLVAMFGSCDPNKPIDDPEEPKKGILVLNEGGFQKGNASLAFYDLENRELKTGLYTEANSKPLGDVGQSMTMINNKLYVVMNNSGLIKVLDPTNLKEVAEITGFTSPRHIVPVSDKKAFVSDLFGNEVKVVDLNVHVARKGVTIKGMTESMAVVGSQLFVTNNATNYVYVVDHANELLVDSVDIGGSSNEIWEDGNRVVVLRNANTGTGIEAAVVAIQAATLEATIVTFTSTETMWYARSQWYNGSMYMTIGNKMMKYTSGSVSELFAFDGFSPYNFWIYENKVWASDAKDYDGMGTVTEYSLTGEKGQSFTPGVIPNDMMYFQLTE
ncbi:MAG: hypothetical protein HYZ16_09915 [Bacteroidetes bacterium]|jgi:hypothetical protein|nr:hypothetical protein [Bacteroidota bacterium]